MKKLKNIIMAAFLGICLLPALQANAQQGYDERDNVIKWNPFSLIYNTFTLSYEKRLSPKLSIQGTVNFTAKSSDASSNSTYNYANGYYGIGQAGGYGIVIDLRYYATYATMQAPAGFYIGPFVRYMAMSFKDDSTTGIGNRISIGGTLGYQAILGNVVSFDMFCGPALEFISGSLSRQASGYYNPNTGGSASPLTVNDLLTRFTPLLPTTGATIGFRCGFTLGVAF